MPLRKHFAHLDSFSTGSHLILCLLHSAPIHDEQAVWPLVTCTYRPLSGLAVRAQGAGHLRDLRLHCGAFALATFPRHSYHPSTESTKLGYRYNGEVKVRAKY